MKNSRLLMALALLVSVSRAHSAPFVIDVDLDPLTAGIQTTLTVTPGTIFTVDILGTDLGGAAGLPPPDTAVLDVLFNDAGFVLSDVAGSAAAGSLAAFALLIDYWSPAQLVPGAPLAPGPTVQPSGPYASSLTGGSVGMFALAGGIPFPPGLPIDVFSVSFLAASPGTSTITAAGAFPGSELLFFGVLGTAPPAGLALPIAFSVSTVTVIPIPAAIWLFGSGLLGLVGMARRKKVA